MTKIIQRHDTAANWTAVNPVLAAGEMGVETDTNKFKFGDGSTVWSGLAYAAGEGGGGDAYTKAETDELLTGKQDKLTAGDGLNISKTLDGVMNYDWYLNNVSLSSVPSTIGTPAVGKTNIYKPYNNQTFSNTANEINITWDMLYAYTSSATGSYIKATGTNGEIAISFDGGYKGAASKFSILCTINSSSIINTGNIAIPYYSDTYLRYMFTFNKTTKIWSITVKNTSDDTEIYNNSSSTSVDIIPTDSLITIVMGNRNGSANGIIVKTDTFSVSSSLEEITQISALPATSTSLGVVQPDGTSITVSETGVISGQDVKTFSGYSDTGTLVLKSINGVLQWVAES